MRNDIIYINGFWKDDKVKFTDYKVKVTEFNDESMDDEEEDSSIFFYGLQENEIQEAIKLKWKTQHDFVITSYHR